VSKNNTAHPSLIPITEDRLLTTSQAAERLGLRTETLKKYRKATSPTVGPKFVRLNDRVVRYKLSDLVAYIAGSEVRI
jgi:hypothetical protein